MIQMKQNVISLQQGLDYFITYYKVKNLSKRTIDSYEECFRYFMDFIQEIYSEKINVNDIDKNVLDSYILNMRENKLKDTTINIRIRSIWCVLYYLMEEEYLERFKIKQVKEDKKAKKVYTDEEIKILLKKPNVKTCKYTEFLTWGIINFLVATGVRSRSVRNVRIEDLYFDNNLIYVMVTKNRKSLIIPMSISLKKVLIEYLRIRGGNPEDYLFCNSYGEIPSKII